MGAPVLSKYRFRIRTRNGSVVENLLIAGQDEKDAKRKLLQMYQGCEILDSRRHSELPPFAAERSFLLFFASLSAPCSGWPARRWSCQGRSIRRGGGGVAG